MDEDYVYMIHSVMWFITAMCFFYVINPNLVINQQFEKSWDSARVDIAIKPKIDL